MKFSIFDDNFNLIHPKIIFDNNGNLYLNFENIPNLNLEFNECQLEIDKNNKPYFDFFNYENINKVNTNFGQIKKLSTKETKNQQQDIEYDIPTSEIPLSHYFEKQGLFFKDEIKTYDDFSEEYEEFHFLESTKFNIPIYEKKNGYYNAVYDTFIKINNETEFYSRLVGAPPLYVITLEKTDKDEPDRFIFRKIGSDISTIYTLTLFQNKIIFKPI